MDDRTINLGKGQTLRVLASSAETLELESTWVGTGKRPPSHRHPRQDERFEVLTGQLSVELDGGPLRELRAGDTLHVPRGTAHRMWNGGPDTTRALWRVTPALRTEEMFRFIGGGLSPLRIATLLWRHRNEYRLRLGR